MQSRGGASCLKTIHILWRCSRWINTGLCNSELQCNVSENHILGQSVTVEDIAPAVLWCLYVALCQFKATSDKVCLFIPWNVSNVTKVEDWTGAEKECIKGQNPPHVHWWHCGMCGQEKKLMSLYFINYVWLWTYRMANKPFFCHDVFFTFLFCLCLVNQHLICARIKKNLLFSQL